MSRQKINKYIEYIQTKIKVVVKEKKYKSNNYTVKYILEKNNCKNDSLIIIFSGCTRIGVSARYNYYRTLKSINANKLFILDNFGYDGRGAYYLGKDMDFKIQKTVEELIKKTQNELNINESIYVGSSKGGYASLYFGLADKNSKIICGAPQYYLSKYLMGTEYNKNKCLSYIVGTELNDENLKMLDNLLKERIVESKSNNCCVFLHFSDKENTYKKHIKDLVLELSENKINYKTDIRDYTEHNEISIYFPTYLKDTITALLNN